ncbi:MAG TPA: c-type cytochrome [Chitinophagaceae bacterium]|nr:c-type cytochrome [Chitinophagaceae bacterium]
MKKSILILSSVLFFISCGNNTDTKETPKDTVATVKEVKDPEVQKGLDFIAKSDCFTCHKLTETAIGPSYAAVAAKYSKIDMQAAKDSIVHQIQNGGSGKWGSVPMQPHPLITKEEASSMAVYIMSIKN